MYYGYIVKVKELRPHPNADRLQIGTFFGNDVILGLDVHLGDLGIYFPEGGQLSEIYCEHNNLVRKRDGSGGYLDPKKRNVKTIKLRGSYSDGIFETLESLAFTNVNLKEFHEGDKIDIVNGIEICKKYIPKVPIRNTQNLPANRIRKKKINIAPLFLEHVDTEQLAYNINAFRPGDQIEITLKVHGTSQRVGYLPRLQGYKKNLWDKIMRKEGTPIYDWGYVHGTRRVIMENFEGGFYGNNAFRKPYADFFEGKLWKGESAYFEIVGYQAPDSPIMGVCKNPDKETIKQYGETTTFHYGCANGESDIYVYRMTITNEDGNVVEYTPEFMRYRCEQMGVKTVPVFYKGFIPDLEDNIAAWTWVKSKAEEFYDGPDPIGKTHIREGVVIRIVNRPKFTAYKHKNILFKMLTGIISSSIEENHISTMNEDILSEL